MRVERLVDGPIVGVFEEGGRLFLLYAVAGERGIGIAEVFVEG